MDMQDNSPPWHLPDEESWIMLDRLIVGDLDVNTRSDVMGKVLNNQSLRTTYQLMKSCSGAQARAKDEEVQQAWRELCIRISSHESYSDVRLVSESSQIFPRANPKAIGKHSFVTKRKSLGLFSGLGIISAIIGVLVYTTPEKHSPQSNGSFVHEMTTLAGQQASIRLKDGSFVTLGPQSKLKLASDFGTTSRNLELYGEALFEIAPDPGVAFMVKTPNSQIRVLGTTLNIRDFSDTTVVAVLDGKVMMTSVHDNVPPLVLSKGKIGWLTQEGSSDIREDDVESTSLWVKRHFVFKGSPLGDVIKTIERHYNVNIITDVAISLDTRITAEWENRNIDAIMISISKLTHAEIEQDGSTIRLVAR